MAALSLLKSLRQQSEGGGGVASETHVGCGAVTGSQRVPFSPERLWKEQQPPFALLPFAASICGLISSPFTAPRTKHIRPQRLQNQTLFLMRKSYQDLNVFVVSLFLSFTGSGAFSINLPHSGVPWFFLWWKHVNMLDYRLLCLKLKKWPSHVSH